MVSKYSYLVKKEWYIQGFPGTPLLVFHALETGTNLMWKKLGYGYEVMILKTKNELSEAYYPVSSLKKVYKEITARYKKDKEYIKRLYIQSEREAETVYRVINKIKETKLDKLPEKGLLELFKEICSVYPYTVLTSHVIEGFALISDKKIKELLIDSLKAVKEDKFFTQYFTMLTTPTEKSLLFLAEENLVRLTDIVRKNKELSSIFRQKTDIIIKELDKFAEFKDKIQEHQREFFWIKASFANPIIGDIGYFIEEMKRVIKEKKKGYPKTAISSEEKERLIKKIRIKGNLLDLIRITDSFTIWQDKRKKYQLSCACYVYMLAKEVARRYKIDPQLIKYITPQEINRNLRKFSNEELELRRRGCIMIYTRKEKNLISGRDYIMLNEEMQKKEAKEKVKEIMGMCASIGKVIGKVQICKSLEDIRKFKQGNVLVTTMTRPEFLPVMKKSIAIVTDEGGITSHAAIISRELGIPCVIGTKIATKVLKDGDLVEVKANHGMVVVIESQH